MSAPDDLRVVVPHPMPGPDHAALLASYYLLLQQADDCLPVRVRPGTPTSFLESWELTRAALIARMASTLRHLGYLAPSYSRLDGAALARTLVEHTITFAWISGQPKDRLPLFLRDGFDRTLNTDRTLTATGTPMLDPAQRSRFYAYLRTHKTKLPKPSVRADEADSSWRERVKATLPPSMRIPDFRELYDKAYDSFSGLDHPSTLGLQVFVHLSDSPVTATVDGEPERDLVEDLRPYWLAMFGFAEALVVSNLASGHPRLGPLQAALETVATLRGLDRSGQLVVTETAEGTTIGFAGNDPAGTTAGST